jgi:hypothetical protein
MVVNNIQTHNSQHDRDTAAADADADAAAVPVPSLPIKPYIALGLVLFANAINVSIVVE